MLGLTGRVDPDVVVRMSKPEGRRRVQMTRRPFAFASVGEKLLLLLLRALSSGSNIAAF
jgi:hypothetical protein